MKCFAHADVDAVGICRACCRGVCRDCVAQVSGNLACSPACLASLGTLHLQISQERARMRATHITQAIAFSVLCAGTAFGGLVADGVGRGVLLAAAALLLLMALRYFKLAAMWREPKE